MHHDLLLSPPVHHPSHFKPGAETQEITEAPHPGNAQKQGVQRGFARNWGPPAKVSPRVSTGISGQDLSDTTYFIRGLHGEYLVSWGQNLLAFAINSPDRVPAMTTNDPYFAKVDHQ
jgi:hypothetical protein